MNDHSWWISAATTYLGLGLVWVLWNSQSRFARTVSQINEKNGYWWATPLSLMVGILIWPLGLLIGLVAEAVKRRKEGEE